MDTQITVLEKNSDSTCFVSACALNSIFGMNFLRNFLMKLKWWEKKLLKMSLWACIRVYRS